MGDAAECPFPAAGEPIGPRLDLVRRFARFTGQYPWQWGPREAEAFFAGLRRRRASTARGYQTRCGLFCEYATDPRYGWPAQCAEWFGAAPQQILHEWNTVAHVADYEGRPGRRPLTYDEVQALFDAADGRAEQIRARGRKGALAAMRDAAMLKTVYAFGLRRREACGLDVADLRRNPKAPGMASSGRCSCGGASPRGQRAEAADRADGAGDGLDRRGAGQLADESGRCWPRAAIRRCGSPSGAAGSRSGASTAFAAPREAAGLPGELDLHALRHSYVTHLVEFDYPERFVQDQVGHAYASTTAIYTGVSDEYRNRLLERSLKDRYGELWEERP